MKVLNLFDTWKELVTAALTFLVVYSGVVLINRPMPDAVHVTIFQLELFALIGMIGVRDVLPKMTEIIKGAPKQ